jgi:nitrogen fixation protein FixH
MNPSPSKLYSASETIEQKEQLAQFLWTGFIILFFAIQALIWTVAILLTSNDASHAVVPGFDPRVQGRVSKSEQHAANRMLGWDVKLVCTPLANQSSTKPQQEVVIEIRDRSGNPLEASSIELSAFHCGQAAKSYQIEVTRRKAGAFHGKLAVSKPGYWQFEGFIHWADETYYLSERLWL